MMTRGLMMVVLCVVRIELGGTADDRGVGIRIERLAANPHAKVALVNPAGLTFEAVAYFANDVGEDQAVVGRAARHGDDLAFPILMLLDRRMFKPQVLLDRKTAGLFSRHAHEGIIP